jgi:NAD(P)-dependent dehydrogenase (short-subunit alcohol dehydrogenase family)
LVTGSARRVGKEIALELARQGMHQIVHYGSSEDEANQTAEEIRALGVKAITARADVRNPDEIAALFEQIRAEYGRLDLLVNSASIFIRGSLPDISLEDWQRVLDVNDH